MHEKELKTMKNNLIIFRNALGWSAEYLGNKLGMSKQAISNLENNASQKMSIVQYVALRLIFDHELAIGINPVYCTIYQCVWCKNKIINPSKKDTLKSELPKLIKENESNKKKWLEEIENNYFIEPNDKFFSNCIDRLTYDSDNSWLTCWLNNNVVETPFIEENNNYLSSFEELVIRQYIYIMEPITVLPTLDVLP